MQDNDIIFHPINKTDTDKIKQSTSVFIQPIAGNYTNLYAELKEKCAPEQFMEPYDPNKVHIANLLYSKLLSCSKEDITTLKELRLQAMEELQVTFSTQKLYDKLEKAINPKNFTGIHYDKEQLEVANQLYEQVLINANNILALEEIEKNNMVKDWIEKYKKEHTLQQSNNCDEEGYGCFLAIIVAFIFLSLIFLIILFSELQKL